MRATIDHTMNELRAMLLELRQAALDERGLVPALTDLCAAYAERLGVDIELDLEAMEVPPPADHALLRIRRLVWAGGETCSRNATTPSAAPST